MSEAVPPGSDVIRPGSNDADTGMAANRSSSDPDRRCHGYPHRMSDITSPHALETGFDPRSAVFDRLLKNRVVMLGSEVDDEIAKEMATRGTFFTPTLMVFNPVLKEGAAARAADRAELSRAAFKSALKAGVRISYGTDAGVYNKHGTNGDEFRRMVEGGMSPMQAIVAATIHNAELFQLSDELGTIEPGKIADIVAVPGNPLEDIGKLNQVSFVMKQGKTYKIDNRPVN